MVDFRVPVLKSSRLTLRAFCADDHSHLLALASDPQVTRYLHEGPVPTPAEVWQRMTGALGQWALRGYGMMAAEDADGFIGRIGFFHSYEMTAPFFVYAFLQRAWGKGYATESARLALDWLEAEFANCEVSALIDPDNVASAGVARKLGARQDGRIERNGLPLDLWRF